MLGVVVPFDQRVAAHGVFSAAWELVEVDVSIEEGSIKSGGYQSMTSTFFAAYVWRRFHTNPFRLRAYLVIGSISPTANGASIWISQCLSRS